MRGSGIDSQLRDVDGSRSSSQMSGSSKSMLHVVLRGLEDFQEVIHWLAVDARSRLLIRSHPQLGFSASAWKHHCLSNVDLHQSASKLGQIQGLLKRGNSSRAAVILET